MSKIYVVTTGNYSDYSIAAVFSSLELAQAHEAVLKGGNRIEEFELDAPSPWPKGQFLWVVQMEEGGTFRAKQVAADDWRCENITPEGRWCAASQWDYFEGREFCLWAETIEHAIKIANERRIMMLAAGSWVPRAGPRPGPAHDPEAGRKLTTEEMMEILNAAARQRQAEEGT